MKKLYKFYYDAGHGWLAVKRSDIIELDLLNKITCYSYQRGNTVYLEVNLDARVFINAWKNRHNKDIFPVSCGKYSERSPIRSYEMFEPKRIGFTYC